jgi:hypothetical protein
MILWSSSLSWSFHCCSQNYPPSPFWSWWSRGLTFCHGLLVVISNNWCHHHFDLDAIVVFWLLHIVPWMLVHELVNTSMNKWAWMHQKNWTFFRIFCLCWQNVKKIFFDL